MLEQPNKHMLYQSGHRSSPSEHGSRSIQASATMLLASAASHRSCTVQVSSSMDVAEVTLLLAQLVAYNGMFSLALAQASFVDSEVVAAHSCSMYRCPAAWMLVK